MARIAWAALTGGLFAAGLALSGMTKPQKVIAFLDVTGDWDPSLALVMGGAIAMFAPLFWWTRRRETVAFGQPLKLPTATHIDTRLVVGSALFGAGWGLGGYCPGPAITAAGASGGEALMFVVALFAGMASLPLVDRIFRGASERHEVADGSTGINSEAR